jgi:hypothetical protein
LVKVALSVLARLLKRKRRPGFTSSRWIPDHAGKIADDENGQMAEVLKLSEFTEDNGMAKMEVGATWVTPEFDVERCLCPDRVLYLSGELVFRNDLGNASPDHVHLLFNAWKQLSEGW